MSGSSRKQLRTALVDLSGGLCEWPNVEPHRGEEMAHIEPKGMGGRTSVDRISNVVFLCRSHHDVLDLRRKISVEELGELGIREVMIDGVGEISAAVLGRQIRDAMSKHALRLRGFAVDEPELE